MYKNTKEVLKAIQNEHEDRLKNHLVSQGSFFSNIVETSLSSVNSIWSLAQRNLPKNILNFSIRCINNSLPIELTSPNGEYPLLLIALSAYSLNPYYMLLQVAQNTLKKVDIHGVTTLSFIFWQVHFDLSKTLLYTWIFLAL